MAERCIPTALLFQTVTLMLKDKSGSVFSHLGLSTGDMSAMDVDTIKFATEITRESVTPGKETITKTDDTVTMSKASWKPNATIYGAGVFTAITGDVLQVLHEWEKEIAFEASDEVTETIKVQSKTGA